MDSYNVPILLIAFNRADKLKLVINRVREIRPIRIFVFVDGPRPNNVKDADDIKLVKETIIRYIDWPCEVKTLFQKKNLGCGFGPATAISWFFKEIEAGIILEDDCVPDKTFFTYVQELLVRYRDMERVMLISGSNHPGNIRPAQTSYYFSKYVLIWGWASWRRAWKHFDHSLIPEADRSHVWDGAWKASVEKAYGLDILPRVNLVENIGFGIDATHTIRETEDTTKHPMQFPLTHPRKVSWDALSDYYTYRHYYGRNIINAFLTVFRRYIGIKPKDTYEK
jgi:hypothetical protein